MNEQDICAHCVGLVDQVDAYVQEYLGGATVDVPATKLDLLRVLVRFAYRVRSGGYRHDWQSALLQENLATYTDGHYNLIGSYRRDKAFKSEAWFPVEYPNDVRSLEAQLESHTRAVPCSELPDAIMQDYTRYMNPQLIRKLYGKNDQEDNK